MKSVRVCVAMAIMGASILGAAPAQAASAQPGKPCSKQGASAKTSRGQPLTCRKQGTRLVWVRQGASGGNVPYMAIPSIIESWGFDLAAYDPATRMAGVMSLAPIPFPADSMMQTPITYYGAPATRPQDRPGFVDPQPTFYLPINTAVRSIITGTVCDVKKLNTGYSDDYSIGVAPTCKPDTANGQGFGVPATWEHEHVMEPAVKVGDKVKAGQVIAKVSYYTTSSWMYSAGIGLFEIGILTGTSDGRAMHLCPALYFAPKMKAALLKQLADAARAYEANTGRTFYSEQTLATGCITDQPSIE